MKKLKDLFEKFLFTVEEVEEVVEDKPEPIVEEIPLNRYRSRSSESGTIRSLKRNMNLLR